MEEEVHPGSSVVVRPTTISPVRTGIGSMNVKSVWIILCLLVLLIHHVPADLSPFDDPELDILSDPDPDPTLLPDPEPDPTILPGSETGYFEILSTPSGADVTFDGSFVGTSPVTVDVSTTGTPFHEILVRMTGYEDWTSQITYNPPADVTETITASLQPHIQSGSISVSSTPSGAMAVLDGSATLTTPGSFPGVTAGTHTIDITLDGYNPFQTTILVADGAESVVSASLTPATVTGSIYAVSDPPGATVILNDATKGTTPTRIDSLNPGIYSIQLMKSGYYTTQKTVEVTAGQESEVNVMLRKIPVTGTLKVWSDPTGGLVSVDIQKMGNTPLTIPGLEPGSHSLRVSVSGYLDYIGIINIVAGRTTTIYATLDPKGTTPSTGAISIESDPSGASVKIDGSFQGKTPMMMQNIIPGSHIVEITADGYQMVTTTAEVRSGVTSVVSVMLTPYPTQNLSTDLITLSDDADIYFTTHGRNEALFAFNDPRSGFLRDNMYIVALDLNGTLLSNGAYPEMAGINLSDKSDYGGVLPARLITAIAREGGGFMYDLSLSGDDPGEVSLVYLRPPISGVVIGTVIPVSEISIPEIPEGWEKMEYLVHEAVLNAQGESGDIIMMSDPKSMTSSSGEFFRLNEFFYDGSDDTDQNGVSPSLLLNAVASDGGGYVWLPDTGSLNTGGLILAYAESVDENRVIWTSIPGSDGEIVVMSTVPMTV